MTAKLPLQDAANEALAERARLVARMNDLTEARKLPALRLNDARAMIEKLDRNVTGHVNPDAVKTLVKARSDKQQAENDLEVIDGELAALLTEIQANDAAIQEFIDGGLSQRFVALKLELIAEVQSELEALAPKVAAIVRRACAINHAIGAFGDFLNEPILAGANGFGRVLVGRLRHFSSDGTRAIELLDQTWRNDPKLLAEFEALRAIGATVGSIQREAERIARERENDPEWQKKRFKEYKKQAAREAEERVKLVAEERARQEREEAEREERFRNVPRNGMEIRMPGTPAPGPRAQNLDAVQAPLDDYHSAPRPAA